MPEHVLHLGDCLDPVTGLASLPDRSVDHVITDPPYAARAMRNARSAATIKQRRDGKVYDFGYSALSDEVRAGAAAQFGRLARRWVIVWSDDESKHLWREALEAAGLRYVRSGFWWRENGAPQFSGDRPAQGVEACVIMHGPERMRWNGGGRPAAWKGPIVNSRAGARRHSSPKPEWLMKTLVRDFTDSGDLVLDPFAGSGTTGVACRRLGRRFLGWEVDPGFHAGAAARLEAAREQLELPAPAARPAQMVIQAPGIEKPPKKRRA